MKERALYWSESKRKFIPVSEMNTVHLRNALRKYLPEGERILLDELWRRTSAVTVTESPKGDIVITVKRSN